MTRFIFDIETNGFLETLTKIHSLVLRDIDTGDVFSCHDGESLWVIDQGLDMLARADMIVGHNIIKFDIPAIQKVYPDWKPQGIVRDTLLLSRLQWPEVRQTDFKRHKRGKFPGKLIGRYSLEAWGHRLMEWKGDYAAKREAKFISYRGPRAKASNKKLWDAELSTFTWGEWSPEMQEYCEQDVAATYSLWAMLQRKPYEEAAVEMEHRFQQVIFMMEQAGFLFDEKRAADLYGQLKKRSVELEADLQAVFRPWWRNRGLFVPKRDDKSRGYVAGAPMCKVDLEPFNPGSRDQIADRLITLRGWRPKEYTSEGKPKVDETTLESLRWPEAKLLTEYLMVHKRIGQIAEGNQAWLKKYNPKTRSIHGSIMTVGAVTRRCTHMDPNIGQVPSVSAPYGGECRALFGPNDLLPGFVQVGADASGIELRCLAHYMARYDGGAWGKALIEGDVHWLNAQAMGLVVGEKDPDNQRHTVLREKCAKTFIYAFLYGCGDEKAGRIVYDALVLLASNGLEYKDLMLHFFGAEDAKPTATRLRAAGKKLKQTFLQKTPALGRVRTQINKAVDKRGYLLAIDGGQLTVRHQHAALNTLLQSAGSIAVKKATVLFYDNACSRALRWGEDYWLAAHIHDELQIIAKEEKAHELGELAVQSIRDAGRSLGFRCPLDGTYKVGRNWAETH